MFKFRVGDKVRKISNGTSNYPIGYEGVVNKAGVNLMSRFKAMNP